MADAKVIPFDDDRSRGGAQRTPRRRAAPRRTGDPGTVTEVKTLPAQQAAEGAAAPAPGTRGPGSGGAWRRLGPAHRGRPRLPAAPPHR